LRTLFHGSTEVCEACNGEEDVGLKSTCEYWWPYDEQYSYSFRFILDISKQTCCGDGTIDIQQPGEQNE